MTKEATYPGAFRATQTVDLAFRVSGPLVEVAVNAGDRVERGQVLMRVDPRDFQKEVEAAEAALASARAKLDAMRSGARQEDIDALEARLASGVARRQYLEAEFERNKRLLVDNAVPKAEYDASEAELAGIHAEIRVLEQELQKARTGERREDILAKEADVRGLESRLAGARDRLSDTTILAPFSGIVIGRTVENHEQVRAGESVVSMHDISELEIDVSLPEKELLHRSIDEPLEASVRLVTLPEERFVARLKEVETKAESATRTYRATFAMPAPAGVNIFPGMIANVTLPSLADGAAERVALVVPLTALQGGRSGHRFVWVVDGGRARRRDVTIGVMIDAARYEVTSGLEGDDPVVASGSALLHEGAEVIAQLPTPEKPASGVLHASYDAG